MIRESKDADIKVSKCSKNQDPRIRMILYRKEDSQGSEDLNIKDIFFNNILIYRCGKTFGADSIDAKKWLQGDSDL